MLQAIMKNTEHRKEGTEMNETRNELFGILGYVKYQDNWRLEQLLERFEIDIKSKIEANKREAEELERDLETLEYVKTEIKNKLEQSNKKQ